MGHFFTQAQHLMHLPTTWVTSLGSMEPMGHSRAHRPHLTHLSGSVTGLAFKKSLMGSPCRSRGV